MRRKDENGNWAPWKGEYDTDGCTESNIFQQSWFVPHDPQGLIGLMGKEQCVANLDRLMAESDLSAMWNEAYNHPNEPCHHLVHFFNDLGQPHKTQYWVRRIQLESYNTTEYGFCGNEDVGQMSAWYLFTAMGFYPVCPGTDQYVLGAPYLPYMKLSLANGQSLEIKAPGVSDKNRYVKAVLLNGKPYTKTYITHEDIVGGGTLEFVMSAKPNKKRGLSSSDKPYSLTNGE